MREEALGFGLESQQLDQFGVDRGIVDGFAVDERLSIRWGQFQGRGEQYPNPIKVRGGH